jgi:predicted  nucleic acid-binding Zn-ribbon protein
MNEAKSSTAEIKPVAVFLDRGKVVTQEFVSRDGHVLAGYHTTLSRLLMLQACDRHIQQVTHKLDILQQSLAALKKEEQAKAQEVRAWQDKIKEGEKARDHLTPQIEQVKGQLRGKRYALYRRRAGQQEETVQREIAFLEESKTALEEELRPVMTQITQDSVALHQAEEMTPTQREERLCAASSLLGQIAATEEELRVAQEKRLALVGGIKESLLQEYERIFSHRGRVAVVVLANETCQGCHMHLPPQMCLELQRRPRLAFCPHCHRILFATAEVTVPRSQSQTPPSDGHQTRPPQRRTRVAARSSKTLLEKKLPQTAPV